MPGIIGILNAGRGALIAQQTAIDVTSQNIANANTPGYSRRRVIMKTSSQESFGSAQMSTGVEAKEIQRIYDRFIDGQINSENQDLGEWEARKKALERVEMVFNETSGFGMSMALNEFWAAWQDLSINPSDTTARAVLLAKSETLATTFNGLHRNLVKIQEDSDNSIQGVVDLINPISQQIADLNQKISEIEYGGQNANGYRDERDLLLKELSSMIDNKSYEDIDGKVSVLINNGKPIVEGNSFWTLTTQIDSSGLQHIFWNDKNGNPFDISTDISNGELKGLLEVRDVEIPNYLNKLDRLSGTIIADVNALHQGGYGLDGSTLIDFFSGSTASDIAVNPEIVRNINKIAAAGSYDILPGDKPGDNSNSIAIGNLQNSKAHNPLLIGGSSYTMDNATFDDTYGSLVWEIGNNVQQATFSAEHQSAMLSHLNNYRESVSGVSLDEEMVSLIKFQHAYEAAAKLITTADELLNTIINMV